MLDRNYIVQNADEIRRNNAARNMVVDRDRFLQLESDLRKLKTELDEVNRQANEHAAALKSKQVRPSNEELQQGRSLKEKRAALQGELRTVDGELLELQQSIPNLTDPRAPQGNSDADNTVIEFGQAPIPEFAFDVRDHVKLGALHGLFDFEAASRVTGQGFYYLKGDAVRLDLALQLYAIEILQRHGFHIHHTPDLARLELIAGTGYNPRGSETQIYSIQSSNLGLIATAEITLAGMHADSIIEERSLPLLLGGLSHCFRTEAGGAGRASRGLYRVHQFSKVEMFAFTRPEDGEATHLKMLEIEKEIFDGLGIPYRVVENATGDLGASAYRKFDLEAWMPGRGAYGEVTSASNCTDYQARRLKIRMRSASRGKSLAFVHTLNGTAIATSRAIVAILENFQEADGSIRIPEPLRVVVGKAKIEG
jgi:seryl-tRNA synthetase